MDWSDDLCGGHLLFADKQPGLSSLFSWEHELTKDPLQQYT